MNKKSHNKCCGFFLGVQNLGISKKYLLFVNMRGARTFQSLFADIDILELPRKEGKGSCAELDARRNELLLIRYMWYGLNTKDRFEVIMCTLENEFFVSQRRITDIVTQNSIRLKELKPNFPTAKELSIMYPHLKW